MRHENISIGTGNPLDVFPDTLRERVGSLARRLGKPSEYVLIDLVESALARRNQVASNHKASEDVPHWSSHGDDDLVDPKEASLRMKLSVSTLAKMRCKGDGPPYIKLGSRSVYYKVRDVDAYLSDRQFQSTSEE